MPHVIVMLVFIAVILAYFYPVLEGKVMQTNDGTVAYNSASEIRAHRDKYGEESLWTNAMFGGMPAYLISVKYYGNLLQYADRILKIFKLPVAAVFLTMAGFYFALLLFKVDYRLAAAGALAFGFSSYFFIILGAGHNTKAFAIAYMAPVIASVWYSYRENLFKGSLLLAFFLSLQILANHPQITYYTLMCILFMIIITGIISLKQKDAVTFIKKSLFLLIPVVLAVGMNFSSLYTTWEYGKYSQRGKSELDIPAVAGAKGLNRDYVTQWSYGIDETLTLLIPGFRGGANKPFPPGSQTVRALRSNNASQYVSSFHSYWGSQPYTDGPVYTGAIVVFLFVIGLILVKGPLKWWLGIATLLSVMLAWGKNFMPLTSLFFDIFPGYNKFRAVTMILVIAEFCMPLLSVLALKEIFEKSPSKQEIFRSLKIALGITGGLTLLFFIFPGISGSFISPAEREASLPAWLTAALKEDRMEMLRTDSFRSLIFIILAGTLIFGFLKEKIRKEYAILLFGILFVADMFPVNKRYLKNDRFVTPSAVQRASAPTVADSRILQDRSIYRVLNLTVSPFNDASTSLYHQSVGGYHGAKMKRYNELIDSVLYPEIIRLSSTLQKAESFDQISPVLGRLNGLNMLNTKYIILNSEMPPLANPFAAGNVWLPEKVIVAADVNEELSAISKIDPIKEAVIVKKFGDHLPATGFKADAGDTISLVTYKANELVYRAVTGNERLAVFSEIWYPAGWKAWIDGKEVPIIRANYVLRALIVPPGSHEIIFRFRPASYYTGEKISYASSVIFIILAAGYIFYSVRKKPAE